MSTLLRILSLAVLLAVLAPVVSQAQNRTTVSITFDGSQRLEERVERRLTSLLTELNRASYFDAQAMLDQSFVTSNARSALRSRWEDRRFRCPKTRVQTSLVAGGRSGTFEVRSIPLLVEQGEGPEAKREGIFVFSRNGQIVDFRYQAERTATPRTGSIVVRTAPSGARVLSAIGGGTQRQSPARFEDVPSDSYAFTIRKDGYLPVEDTTFAVRPGTVTEYTVPLTSTTGTLQIADVPAGATVTLDGDDLSVNGPLDVTTGEHTVQVSKPYFTTWDTTITVPPDQSMTIEPALQRKQVPLSVRSTPEGATVFLNEDSVGTTPLKSRVAAGREYTIRLTKAGHLPSPPMSVTAVPDSSVKQSARLTRVETRSQADEARIANVEARRSNGLIDLRYDLVGKSGETYTVSVDAFGSNGSRRSLSSDTLRGDVGTGLKPGPDKMMQWPSTLDTGASVRLTLASPAPKNRLFYLVGGAAALTGTAAAILLGGGKNSGSTSFPAPPGLPQ